MTGFFFKFWKAGLIALLIVALYATGLHARRIAAERDEMAEAVRGLSVRIAAMDDAHRRAMAAVDRKVENDRRREAAKHDAKIEIEKARRDGDGPLAPVLRDTLERLRRDEMAAGRP